MAVGSLCLRGYRTQRAVINPKNKDDRCFLYAVYLGLLDLSKIMNSVIASQLRKGVRDQKVTVNCSLPMPVEPTPANFRKFEVDTPHIHLNVYGALGDESRSPVTPLYISSNKDKDAQMFTRNEEGKRHYSFIRNMLCLMYSVTKNHKKKQVCPHCNGIYFHSERALNNHLKKHHPHCFHGHVCL